VLEHFTEQQPQVQILQLVELLRLQQVRPQELLVPLL
jgi:hypothetical protein